MGAFSGHIGSEIGLTRGTWLMELTMRLLQAFKEFMLACGDRASTTRAYENAKSLPLVRSFDRLERLATGRLCRDASIALAGGAQTWSAVLDARG